MALVLCTGVDAVLITTRKMLLERAGHTVVPAVGEADVRAACAQHKFDIAVIGQAITIEEKVGIFRAVRRHCPSAKVLELYRPPGRKRLPEADAWLAVPADVPSELVAEVDALTKRGGERVTK